jgi:hypothetical protein
LPEEEITDSFSYKTDSGENMRLELSALEPDEAYRKHRARELHDHWTTLVTRVKMLDFKQLKQVGRIDERHTIVLKLDGVRLIPAFQFDAHGKLKQNVIRINEELAPDVSPWDAFGIWLRSPEWTGILLGRDSGYFSGIRAIDLVDGPYELLEPLVFDAYRE